MIKKYSLIIVFVVLLIVIISLPIEYPISVNSKGKLLPFKTLILSKGTDGRLITSLTDNSTGIDNFYTVTQFERGDAVQFKFNSSIINGGKVTKGDTIGFIISNEIEKDIQKLIGELETAQASLNVQSSSEKQSIIDAEKSKLEFAEMELDEQTKIYNRKKLLFERNLISQQEFEADEARYELAKININIAKERVKTVESGAKAEEIKFTETQIRALENEISVLQKRYESNNIISPINGIINKAFSTDTLLTVNDTSKYIIVMPINFNELGKLQIDQKVEASANVDELMQAKIISIGNSVSTSGFNQYVLVTAISESKINLLKPGLYVDCEIDCGSATAYQILKNFFLKK
jgi:multidrug efflux pump subunit AcrA (membrane-fusion protein)